MMSQTVSDIKEYFALWPLSMDLCQPCKAFREQFGETPNRCPTCDARLLLNQALRALESTAKKSWRSILSPPGGYGGDPF